MKAIILIAALLGRLVVAGECIPNPLEKDTYAAQLFFQAMKAGGDYQSSIYGNNFKLCLGRRPQSSLTPSTMVRREPTVWIPAGDHKCGQESPFKRTEHVSTEILKSDYEKYVRNEIRLWVTDPSGSSAILRDPSSVKILITQSIYDCLRNGPTRFTCPAGQGRPRCCRKHLVTQPLFEARYDHPFQKDVQLVVKNDRDAEAVFVSKAGGKPSRLQCGHAFRNFLN